ncbi:hypothetical protein [Hafnia phage Pocis76]|uniref:Uncharacterized protein n=1 Tax=Hafnia phage Pocis76 TaxID=2831174 RepID=A0A8E7KY23_9CAUD|nr:hypothetical protein [Hafnia phage Pocis76]
MKFENLTEEQKEVVDVFKSYIIALASMTEEFLDCVDLDEDGAIDYVRNVWVSVDNVVLAILNASDDEKRREGMRNQTELRIQQMLKDKAAAENKVH